MMLYKFTITFAANHKSTTGANVKPTLLVPNLWTAKRSTRIAHVTPTMVPALLRLHKPWDHGMKAIEAMKRTSNLLQGGFYLCVAIGPGQQP